MSRKPRAKPMFKRGPGVFAVDKLAAAVCQLEGAILLWFMNGSPVAIHGLAAAAHDCFYAMCKDAKKPTLVQTWLDAQTEAFRERARYFQNFIKHGFKDLKREAMCSTKYADFLVWGSIVAYEDLHNGRTPLMALWLSKFQLENPELFLPEARADFGDSLYSEYVLSLNRREFLDEIFPEFRRFARSANIAHIHLKPPSEALRKTPLVGPITRGRP